MTVEGIDVSQYQAATPDLSAVEFLIARATYGTGYPTFGDPDPKYAQHKANARKAGKVFGAYHFGVRGNVAAQIALFVAAAGDADFFVLDLESDGSRPRMTDVEARAFIVGVRALVHSHKVGLYHSESGFPSLGQDYNWIAKWGTIPPSGTWTFWQYRGSPLDLDRYHGTVAQLRAFAGLPTPASPWQIHIAKGTTFNTYRLSGGRAILSGSRTTKRGFTASCELLTAKRADGSGTISLARVLTGGYARVIVHRTDKGITVRKVAP